jgi:hypothetical protein
MFRAETCMFHRKNPTSTCSTFSWFCFPDANPSTGITNEQQGGGTWTLRTMGVVGGRHTSVMVVKTTRQFKRDAECFCKLFATEPSSGLLMGVFDICVLHMRRRFSVNFPSGDSIWV